MLVRYGAIEMIVIIKYAKSCSIISLFCVCLFFPSLFTDSMCLIKEAAYFALHLWGMRVFSGKNGFWYKNVHMLAYRVHAHHMLKL